MQRIRSLHLFRPPAPRAPVRGSQHIQRLLHPLVTGVQCRKLGERRAIFPPGSQRQCTHTLCRLGTICMVSLGSRLEQQAATASIVEPCSIKDCPMAPPYYLPRCGRFRGTAAPRSAQHRRGAPAPTAARLPATKGAAAGALLAIAARPHRCKAERTRVLAHPLLQADVLPARLAACLPACHGQECTLSTECFTRPVASLPLAPPQIPGRRSAAGARGRPACRPGEDPGTLANCSPWIMPRAKQRR